MNSEFEEAIGILKNGGLKNKFFDTITFNEPAFRKYFTIIENNIVIQNAALDVIKNEPFKVGNAIQFIKMYLLFPNMLDYEHYCLTIRDSLDEKDFNTLVEWIKNNNKRKVEDK